MEKAGKAVFAALYAGGALAVAVLSLLAVAGPKYVPFPDSMLPVDLRELAFAWLAIGFLPMLLASARFYKAVRRKAVFLPAAICLLALLVWIGAWTVGMFRSPLVRGREIALPQAEDVGSIHFTGDGLDLTVQNRESISQFLHSLSQAKNTGRASVSDATQGAEAVLVELHFRQGGSSRLFLYRDGAGFMAEQPYQGIYRADDGLEDWLREQAAQELGRGGG